MGADQGESVSYVIAALATQILFLEGQSFIPSLKCQSLEYKAESGLELELEMCFSCLCEKKHIRKMKIWYIIERGTPGSRMWTKYKALVVSHKSPWTGFEYVDRHKQNDTWQLYTAISWKLFQRGWKEKAVNQKGHWTLRHVPAAAGEAWFSLPERRTRVRSWGASGGISAHRSPGFVFCFGSLRQQVVGEGMADDEELKYCALWSYILHRFMIRKRKCYTASYVNFCLWCWLWRQDQRLKSAAWSLQLARERALCWATGANTCISRVASDPLERHIWKLRSFFATSSKLAFNFFDIL